jgi:uncharacterized RDD family membrane protein YckC
MTYAGFWRRAAAFAIDDGILLVVSIPAFLYMAIPVAAATAVALMALQSLFVLTYVIWFHIHGGQTPGKRLMGIRLLLLDGSPATRSAVFRRHSPEIFSTVLGFVSIFSLYGLLQSASWQALPFLAKAKALTAATPRFEVWRSRLSSVWMYSELIVILLNKERRALHDFLGGTVVVREPPNEIAFWRRRSASERSERRADRR